jgi:UDP-glucose 4-epimerase
MNAQKSTILVTGGAGYIGSHTVVELQQAGFEVVIIDNLSNSSADTIDRIYQITGQKPHFEKIDCLEYNALEEVFKKYPKIEAVIHFAANKAVGESTEKPLLYYRNNLGSLLNVIEIMLSHKVQNLVFSSSCTVYGEPDSLPVVESASIQPAKSPYGNTKQICEEIIRDTINSGACLKSVLLRYFNPIGAHPSSKIGELPNGVPQNLVPFITQTAVGIQKELKVFGNDYDTPDGTCIRDYISVVDLAKAHVAAIQFLLKDSQNNLLELFNIGTGKGLSVLELITIFEKVTGIKLPYILVGRRSGDISKVWANPTKANKILNWKAEESIDATLLSAWKWEQKIRS